MPAIKNRLVASNIGVVEYKPNFVAIAADDHKNVKNKPTAVFIFSLLKTNNL